MLISKKPIANDLSDSGGIALLSTRSLDTGYPGFGKLVCFFQLSLLYFYFLNRTAFFPLTFRIHTFGITLGTVYLFLSCFVLKFSEAKPSYYGSMPEMVGEHNVESRNQSYDFGSATLSSLDDVGFTFLLLPLPSLDFFSRTCHPHHLGRDMAPLIKQVQ
jgi:hypothetical protein